jgi:hypothetical protein
MPGYMPPDPKTAKMIALQPKGGGFDSGGTYALTDQEQKLDCKQLTGSVKIKILQMRQADERKTPSGIASKGQETLNTFKGGGSTYGMDLQKDLAGDHARLQTLNRRLAEKNCKTFDLQAELAPGNSAIPEPKGTTGKK